MGPLGELGALFNPGMRHEIEERKSKANRREEEGNARDGDLRIDLASGVAVINMSGGDHAGAPAPGGAPVDPALGALPASGHGSTSSATDDDPGASGSEAPGDAAGSTSVDRDAQSDAAGSTSAAATSPDGAPGAVLSAAPATAAPATAATGTPATGTAATARRLAAAARRSAAGDRPARPAGPRPADAQRPSSKASRTAR